MAKGPSPTELLTINRWDELNVELSKEPVAEILMKVANRSKNGRYTLKPELLATLDLDTYPYKASRREEIKERIALLQHYSSSRNRSPEVEEEATFSRNQRGLDEAPVTSPKRRQRPQVIDLTSDIESETGELAAPTVLTQPSILKADESLLQHTNSAKINAPEDEHTSDAPNNEPGEERPSIQTEQVEEITVDLEHPVKGEHLET